MSFAGSPAQVPQHHHHAQLKPCHTLRCERSWGRRHHWHPPAPPFRFTPFALCVANHESGTGTVATPENSRFSTIDWRYDAGGYEGAFNWVHSTWLAMKQPSDPEYAYEASPRQQTEVFLAHANPHDWPESVPACSG